MSMSTCGLLEFGQAELRGRARGDAGLVGQALLRIPEAEAGWGC